MKRQRLLPLVLSLISFFLVASLPFVQGRNGSAIQRPGPQDAILKISHRARAVQPGEVVLITLQAMTPLRSVEGNVLGRVCLFHPEDQQKTRWTSLIGIDLEAKPGTSRLAIRAISIQGEALQDVYDLPVKPKKFQERRLTVDEKFVNPPAESLERIGQESRRLEGIFRENTPERLWQGRFLRPVPGVPTSSFGNRSVINGQPRSPHAGTDFRASEGTTITAPNNGQVVLSADLYFTGNTVIVDHGQGLYSYFAHLSRSVVSEGNVVARGDLLGYVGATGRVSGPHLHWSLRLNKARVDPLSLVALLASDPEVADSSH